MTLQEIRIELTKQGKTSVWLASKLGYSTKFEFTGELEREETVLGKEYCLGNYWEEREEVQAICTADLSRWRTEKEKVYFNTSIDLD